MYDKAQLEKTIKGLAPSPKERDPKVLARAAAQIKAVLFHMAKLAGLEEAALAKLDSWASEIASVRRDRWIAVKSFLRDLSDADEKTVRAFMASDKFKRADAEDALRHYIAKRLEEDGINRGSDRNKAEFYSRLAVIAETPDVAAGYACAVMECAMRVMGARTAAKNIDHVVSKIMGVVETAALTAEPPEAKAAPKGEAEKKAEPKGEGKPAKADAAKADAEKAETARAGK